MDLSFDSNDYVRFGNPEGTNQDNHIDLIIVSTDITRDLYELSGTINYPG